jgi:hypothetical protein
MVAIRTPLRLVKLGLVLWCGLGAGCEEQDDQDFNEEVIQCEEAVAHLETCCGSLDGHVRCIYVPPTYEQLSCDSPMATSEGTYPDIGPESSKCYRGLSCDQVRERGLCEAFRGTAAFMEACE